MVIEDDELPEEATRWMAIARVHTEKAYSQYWFYRNMQVTWDLAKEVKIRPLEDNLYTLQFGCLGDWNKAMLEGPWLFREQAVIMEEYDGFRNPDTFVLNKISVWAQIHRLPDKFLIEPAVKGLASRIGEVEEVQLKLPEGFF